MIKMSIPGNDADTQQNQEQQQGVKPEEKVDWEKRFKDTQGALTRVSQELASTKAKVQELESLVPKQPLQMTEEQKLELEELKISDPDAWRVKLNAMEQDQASQYRQRIDGASEIARRQQVLADFMTNNPDIVLNDDVIKYDIPMRISEKLSTGELTFEGFLNECANFLRAPKGIKVEPTLNQPDLGKAGGDGSPLNTSGAEKQTPYSKTIF